MKLSIITLNFKKPSLTIDCLRSIYSEYKNQFENNLFEIVIIDNYSQDDSVEILQNELAKHKYKNVSLHESKENNGFGSGNNIGAFKSKGKYILFLNNDTQVKDDGFLRMVEYMENHLEASILGGQLRNFDNSPQSSAGKFYTPIRVVMLLMGMQRFGLLDENPNSIQKVDWVKGALLMIRREVFEKLKGFDEKIFMYTEDMELCYRAKLAGFNTYFYPNILVMHSEHGSSNRAFAISNIYKNLLYFYSKHRTREEYMLVKGLLFAKAIILVICGRILHNSYLTNTYEKALATIN